MSESSIHKELVNLIVDYVVKVTPNDKFPLIQSDTDHTDKPSKVLGNYIPDVMYDDGELFIIGEAKTFDDFERKHSLLQYDSYISTCKLYSPHSMLIVAVPWGLIISAKNYFRRIKRKENLSFEIVILDEFGRSYLI